MKTLSFFKRFNTIVLTVISLLLVCDLITCQELEKSVETKQLGTRDFHIKKAKENRKTGIILGSLGGACFLTGAVILIYDTIDDVDDAIWDATWEGEGEADGTSDLSTGLMIGGAVVGLASVPFFIKAKEHKKKAKLLIGTSQVQMSNTKVNIPKNIGISLVIAID